MEIGYIGDRLGSALLGEGVATTVCVSAKGNEISSDRRQELFRRYKKTLGKVMDLGSTLLCGTSCPAGLQQQDGGLKHLQ